MATATVTYSFASDLDGLTGSPGSADTTMSYASGVGNPSGSAKTLTTTRNQNDDSFWYEDTTWEGLGVSSGATVTDIRVNAGYYYQGLTDWNTVDGVTPGPFEIRTQDDITTIASMWTGSTETSQGSGWTSIGAQSDQSIGASYQASNTAIRVRFGHNIDLGNNASAAADLHLDELQLVITYTPAPVTGAAIISGSGDLTAIGNKVFYGIAPLAGSGDLTATGQQIAPLAFPPMFKKRPEATTLLRM